MGNPGVDLETGAEVAIKVYKLATKQVGVVVGWRIRIESLINQVQGGCIERRLHSKHAQF